MFQELMVERRSGKYEGIYRAFTLTKAKELNIPYLHWEQAMNDHAINRGDYVLTDTYQSQGKIIRPALVMECLEVDYRGIMKGQKSSRRLAILILPTKDWRLHSPSEYKEPIYYPKVTSQSGNEITTLDKKFKDGIGLEELDFMAKYSYFIASDPISPSRALMMAYILVYRPEKMEGIVNGSIKQAEAKELANKALMLWKWLGAYAESGMADAELIKAAMKDAKVKNSDIIEGYLDLARDPEVKAEVRKATWDELAIMGDLKDAPSQKGTHINIRNQQALASGPKVRQIGYSEEALALTEGNPDDSTDTYEIEDVGDPDEGDEIEGVDFDEADET